jgi:hypothetical protein
MGILQRIKNTAAGLYVATGKVQEQLSQNTIFGVPDNAYIQQVKQQQINLLSKKRFYNILEHADDYMSNKYRMENDITSNDRTFKNKRYGSSFENIGGDDSTATYHLKTNNLLGRYADYVNVINENNQIVLQFVINTQQNPSVRVNNFTDLTHLKINESGKSYSFNVFSYLGSTQENQFELSLYYQASIEKFGEYEFDLDDTRRVLTSKDCPPKNTINYM